MAVIIGEVANPSTGLDAGQLVTCVFGASAIVSYEQGYIDGNASGFATGYSSGYSDGYTAGYDDGFADGTVNIDVDPPVLSNVDPPNGTPLGTTNAEGKNRVVSFDVTDVTSQVQLLLITLKYTGLPSTEVVFNGTSFVFPFNSIKSFREPIPDGYRYHVCPINGWKDSIEQLFVYAIDAAGNLEGTLPP